MHDILRESPFYQEILQEGHEEGFEEGLERGHQQGKLDALRETLLAIVQARFPKLLRLSKGLAYVTEDPVILQRLILEMSIAQSFEEAQKYLVDESIENNN